MEQELLKVTELAARLGVSPQAVYKRLKTTFNRYVVIVDGVTMIDAAAVEVAKKRATIQPTNNQPQHNNNPTNPTVDNPISDELRRKIEEQKDIIERLQKELEEARADIKKKDEQLENITARLLNIAESQNELVRNSQVLVAQAQTQKKGFFARLFAPKERKENVYTDN